MKAAPTIGPTIDYADQLRLEINRWEGTPHRLGGISRSGIDCSGFSMILYRDVFGIQLPRTTRQQVRLGNPVLFTDIKPGDLVFFLPESKEMHMGIYLGQDEFAHASTSQGVMVSNIRSSYWRKVYLTARRLMDL